MLNIELKNKSLEEKLGSIDGTMEAEVSFGSRG